MKELFETITQLVMEFVENTHPDIVDRFADFVRVEDAGESSSYSQKSSDIVGANQRGQRLLKHWQLGDITGKELWGILIGANRAHARARAGMSIDLVWTGPSSQLVATRKTEQVLLEVIDRATDSLFLVSFVAYGVPSVVSAVHRAVQRGVEVSILLESSEQHGGELSLDSIDMLKNALPRAKVYYWKDKGSEFSGGKVHAKVAVADSMICFISSANLTGHAMERNMEAGVSVRGGDLPRRLHRHLEALASVGVIAPVE